MTLALPFLYISQLVYVLKRWFIATKELNEKARVAQMRSAIDWKKDKPSLRK